MASRSRYAVLGAFALLVVTTQLLWLTFAPITDQSAAALGVDAGAIGDLAIVNPAMFVILAIPAGRWMDRHYSTALAAGALFTGTGAVIRAFDATSFGWVLAGQIVMSVGQPLVLSAITKLAARYFPPTQQTMAISVGSGAQFVGVLAAMLLAVPLYDAGGLRLVLTFTAAFAALSAVAVLASLRVPALNHTQAHEKSSLAWLRRDSLTWRLAALLLVGFGAYNGLATWLDSIMTDFGYSGAAGNIIAGMTLAGIAGAALLPGPAAAREWRRNICLATTILLAVAMVGIVVLHSVWFVAIALAVVGFALLGTLPVTLDWSELHVGPQRAGTATAFLLMAGNVGGVLVTLSVQAVIDSPEMSLIVLALWAIPGFVIAYTLPRRAGEHAASPEQPEGAPA